jgi:hypothetical protein
VNIPNADKCIEVVQDEYNLLLINKTWAFTKLPKGKHAIGCKWIFHIKTKSNGSIYCHKTCLVAKGYTQVFGVDFENIFLPMV